MLAGGISPVRAQIIHGQGQTEVVFRRSDRWKSVVDKSSGNAVRVNVSVEVVSGAGN